MQSIYDILLSNATLLELYRSKGYTDTQLALQNALELINARILKTNGQWTTQKLNAIKKLIQDEITKSYNGLFESLQDESTAIAQITYNAIIGSSMSASIPTALINNLTNSTRTIQGYEFKELFKLTQDNHARQLRVSLASAIGAGLTPTQITQELNKKNESLTKAQLATNVRTVIFDSANEATYKSYAKLEKDGLIDYYEYVAVLDSRTSEVCRNSDGRRFYMPIDEIPAGDRPQKHFNCRSKLVAGNKYSRQDGTRASQFGAVNSNETYSTWFAKQSPTFQKRVLGGKYNAYKSGVYRIGGLPDVLGKKIGLEEIKDTMEEFVTTPKVPVIDFGYDGKFNKYVEDIRDEAKIIIDKLPKPSDITSIGASKGALYMPSYDILLTQDSKAVFLHEYGHNIDYKIGKGKSISQERLSKSATKDYILLDLDSKEVLSQLGKDFTITKKVGKYNVMEFKDDDSMMLSDIIDSLTKGIYQDKGYGLGHGGKYYKTLENRNTEIFANLFYLWSNNKWDMATKLFPNMAKEFENIMQEVIDGKFD